MTVKILYLQLEINLTKYTINITIRFKNLLYFKIRSSLNKTDDIMKNNNNIK